MNYNKLLEDYLNKDGNLYKLIYFDETEEGIYVTYREILERDKNTVIPLFDLLTFVYSKISV